jgi:hypothetical protein
MIFLKFKKGRLEELYRCRTIEQAERFCAENGIGGEHIISVVRYV